jgi:hypothetical protein
LIAWCPQVLADTQVHDILKEPGRHHLRGPARSR